MPLPALAGPRTTVSIEAAPGIAHRTMRIELACARALLDAIEIILNVPSSARSRSDVVAQIADQLSRVAIIIQQWQDGPHDDEFPEATSEESSERACCMSGVNDTATRNENEPKTASWLRSEPVTVRIQQRAPSLASASDKSEDDSQ
jgi:hypothetical protein